MRGVTEQHDAALMPMPDRGAIADLSAPPEVEHRNEIVYCRMRLAIGALQLRTIRCRVALLAMGRGPEHRDDVEQRALAQRIVHDVEAGAAPQHDLLAMDVGG